MSRIYTSDMPDRELRIYVTQVLQPRKDPSWKKFARSHNIAPFLYYKFMKFSSGRIAVIPR